MMVRPVIFAVLTLLFSASVGAQNCVNETVSGTCHKLAYCTDNRCSCPEGVYGNGVGEDGCSTTHWSVRTVVKHAEAADFDRATFVDTYIGLLIQGDPNAARTGGVDADLLQMMRDNMYVHFDSDTKRTTLIGLFATEPEATIARNKMFLVNPQAPPNSQQRRPAVAGLFNAESVDDGPDVYRRQTGTTDQPIEIAPTGLEVLSVFWDPSCLSTGCWTVDILFAVGKDNFNVLYIPKTPQAGTEPDYDDVDFLNTYRPAAFPCRTFDIDYQQNANALPDWRQSACCIMDFATDFRATEEFILWKQNKSKSGISLDNCPANYVDGTENTDYDPPAYKKATIPDHFIAGLFEGMTSYAESLGPVDAFVGTYKARLYLDDVEMRTQAGIMRGFPSIEYSVDTFVGLAEFKPTEIKAFDPFTKQVKIHVEATRFMTVAVHEYVGPRLKDACCGSECSPEGACPNGENVNCKMVYAPFTDPICPTTSCWCCGSGCSNGTCPEGNMCEIRCSDEYAVDEDMCKPDYCCGSGCVDGKCPAAAEAAGMCEMRTDPVNPDLPCAPQICCGELCEEDGTCPAGASSEECYQLPYEDILNDRFPCAPRYCCGSGCEVAAAPTFFTCTPDLPCDIRTTEEGKPPSCAPTFCCGSKCRDDGSCPSTALPDECWHVQDPPNPLEPCAPTYCCGEGCVDGVCPNGEGANCEVVTADDFLAGQTEPCALKYCCGEGCLENPVRCKSGYSCTIKLVQADVPSNCDDVTDKRCCGPKCRADGSCPTNTSKPQCWIPGADDDCDSGWECQGAGCDKKCTDDPNAVCCTGGDCNCTSINGVDDCKCEGPDCCIGNECTQCEGPDCDNDCVDWNDPTCKKCNAFSECCTGPSCRECSGPDCDSDCINAGPDDDMCCAGADCSCECDGDDCDCECTGANCCLGQECDDCIGPDCDSDCDDWEKGKCCIGSGCNCDAEGDCTCTGDCCTGESCATCQGADCDEDTNECTGPNCCFGSGCDCASGNCDCTVSGSDECCVGLECNECKGGDCDDLCVGPDCCYGDYCDTACTGSGCDTDCENENGDGCCIGDCVCDGDGCECAEDGDCCVGDCDTCQGEDCGSVCDDWTTGDCSRGPCDPSGQATCCTGPSCDQCQGKDCDCEQTPGICVCTGDDCCFGDACDCFPDDYSDESVRGTCTCKDDNVNNCCIGPSCNSCEGDGCEDVCTGENCCFGSSCATVCNATTGVCDECPKDATDCCQGIECNKCTGSGCSEAVCEMQGGCYECPADLTGPLADCCDGPECNHCQGAGCNYECTGPECCWGAGCSCNATSCPECQEGDECCSGQDCPCEGEGCKNICTGPECCHGAGCDCSATSCEECAANDDTCCKGESCNECSGDCDEDCVSDDCCSGDCDCAEANGVVSCECDELDETCCTGPKCDEPCTGCGCDEDEECDCVGKCCPVGGQDSTDPCCVDPTSPECKPPCKSECCDSDDECCQLGANCCTSECCDSTDGCCDPDGDNADCDCQGDCCPGAEAGECCENPGADECDACKGTCCESMDPCCVDPEADGCCHDPSGCCDPEATCCDSTEGYEDSVECCDGDCCGDEKNCCVADGKDECCVDEEGCCDGADECDETTTRDDPMVVDLNLRIIEVRERDPVWGGPKDTVDPETNSVFHYLQVAVTFASWVEAHDITGVFPLSSILIGYSDTGKRSDATMVQGCRGTNSIWEDNPLCKKGYEQMITNQTGFCAPDAKMCEPVNTIEDQFAVINIPLTTVIPADLVAGDGNLQQMLQMRNVIFVESVITAKDRTNMVSKSTISGAIPVVPGGVQIFCRALTDRVTLEDAIDVDLILGSANNTAELNRLRLFENLQDQTESLEVNSDSIESGLMTLIIKGRGDFFNRSRTQGFSVELEDLITLHFMEPSGNSNKFSAVLTMINAVPQTAFSVTIDRIGARAQMTPSAGLLRYCTFNPRIPTSNDPLPETCIIRRDVENRGYPVRQGGFATAMEITPQFTQGTEIEFMSDIFGSSDYTADLATRYSRAIHEKYGMPNLETNRYTRAYWINPGYEWLPTQFGSSSRFLLSQRLIMVALIGIDEGADYGIVGQANVGGRRRMLSALAQDPGQGTQANALKFNVDEKANMAAIFQVDPKLMTTWTVKQTISVQKACGSESDLLAEFKSTLDKALSDTNAKSIKGVSVNSVTISMNGASCERRASGQPEATYDTLIAFSNNKAAIDLAALASKGLEFEAVDVSEAVARTEIPEDAADEEDDSSSSSNVGLIAGICGGVGGLLVIAAGVVMYMRNKSKDEVAHLNPVVIDDLKHLPMGDQ